MTKTRHPCAGLTKGQRHSFEAIATGQQPEMRDSVRNALLAHGLIRLEGSRYVGQFAGVPIMAPVYGVPTPIHMQWCDWCSENVSSEECT